ncbi:helix-turn-helix transcriptional regulator [Micromonospora sp. DR5-3]|uniref:helix-turn-helix domain-containing protein n=1 Tax=unclassified Micromonospora TaxID=2617518 RepID=UPI0021055818|nr:MULTISPECIES: helix-turn-helix transcriptional regulator [unclassified Micromonospora]MCW3813740.1 helix-turn-helix transcriptional regulator [Micromonospora sp. DR5-3]
MEEWLTQPEGLADRLRALRTQAGLSGKELAEANGWAPSKVSRLENGRQMPAPADLYAWARACGADDTAAQELLRMLGEVQSAHRSFRRRMRQGQAAVQDSYNQMVAESRLIRHFETVWVPGLLQTADYARRALTEMVELHNLDIADVDAAVATRMQRQQFLYDASKRFEFLLAEPVLRWLITSPEVKRGQLDRLQTIVGVPNIRFGILPLGVPLATTPQNSFQMYDDVAIVETFVGETTYRDDEAATYTRAIERLWEEAVTGEDARRLIVRAAQELQS